MHGTFRIQQRQARAKGGCLTACVRQPLDAFSEDRITERGKTKTGDFMKYKDPQMEQYWKTLPPGVQTLIEGTGAEISSLGMLTKLGEYYKNDTTLEEKQEGSIT